MTVFDVCYFFVILEFSFLCFFVLIADLVGYFITIVILHRSFSYGYKFYVILLD